MADEMVPPNRCFHIFNIFHHGHIIIIANDVHKTSIICKASSKTYINSFMHVRYAFGYMFSNSLVPFAFKIGQNLATKQVVALLNKINITTYFENLTVKLHILYAFNIHVKFCVNRILIIYYMIY